MKKYLPKNFFGKALFDVSSASSKSITQKNTMDTHVTGQRDEKVNAIAPKNALIRRKRYFFERTAQQSLFEIPFNILKVPFLNVGDVILFQLMLR